MSWKTSKPKGCKKKTGMNLLEARYAAHLELRQRAGEIEWFSYEAVTLKLASDTRYTPDFIVMLAGGEIEMHETKGFGEMMRG